MALLCGKEPCRDQFKCLKSHGCIDFSLLCNGKNDCVDGSDEMGCIDHGGGEELLKQCTNA